MASLSAGHRTSKALGLYLRALLSTFLVRYGDPERVLGRARHLMLVCLWLGSGSLVSLAATRLDCSKEKPSS